MEISSECPQAPVVGFCMSPVSSWVVCVATFGARGKISTAGAYHCHNALLMSTWGPKSDSRCNETVLTSLTILTLDSLDVKIAAVILAGPQGHRTRHQEGGRLKHVGSPGLVSHVISFLLDKVVGCYSPCGKLSYSIHGMVSSSEMDMFLLMGKQRWVTFAP